MVETNSVGGELIAGSPWSFTKELIHIYRVEITDTKGLNNLYEKGRKIYVEHWSTFDWRVLHRKIEIPKNQCKIIKTIEFVAFRSKRYPYEIEWPKEWQDRGDK